MARAEKHYAGKSTRLDIRFKGPFCYIDAYTEPDPSLRPLDHAVSHAQFLERLRSTPIHLCRLRHFAADRWSLAFYTYSTERYVPAVFSSGEWFGTPEEGFDIGAVHLTG